MFSSLKKKIGARVPFFKLSDRDFLVLMYQEILGRKIDAVGLEIYSRLLEEGRSRWEVILYLIRSEEFIRKTVRENAEILSDRVFLEQVYPIFYQREIDAEGLETYLRLLRGGHDRFSILSILADSQEFIDRILRKYVSLKNIKAAKPEAYGVVRDRWSGEEVLVFQAGGAEDFDWLEGMLSETRYYERPGIWSFELDPDKKVMAEIMAQFSPKKALEIGCSNGAVLKSLLDLGIEGEGIEISAMALNRAFPDIRDRIHLGDLLALKLPSPYDLIFGLDIFEHLNPNKLDAYIRRIVDLLSPGGYLYANIPVFGEDPIFGNLFPVYLDSWEHDRRLDRPFHTLHVDQFGYPLHGHLIWADTAWWVGRFETAGLVRQTEIEKELHRKYDDFLRERAPARMAFFVFSRKADTGKTGKIIKAIRQNPSRFLEEWGKR